MRRSIVLLLLCFVFAGVLLFPVSSPAQGTPAQESLEAFLSAIRSMDFSDTAAAKQAKLVEEADSHLDLDTMGKKSIAAHWDKITPGQQEKFLELLWELIRRTAYRRSHDFIGSLNISFPEVTEDAGGTLIKSIVRQEAEGIDTEVIYHLSQKDGVWKIDDVILDGVTIVEDLKYQFDKIIQDSNFDGLLETMQKRLDDAIAQVPATAA